jgi:hypothetical protein
MTSQDSAALSFSRFTNDNAKGTGTDMEQSLSMSKLKYSCSSHSENWAPTDLFITTLVEEVDATTTSEVSP